MNLSNYFGLEYGRPFNCIELVVAIRNEFELETPYYGKFTGRNSIRLLKKNSAIWSQRRALQFGDLGDIVLLSSAPGIPEHHCGVVISESELIHILPGSTVCALNLSQVFYNFPGGGSRWFYES